MTRQRKPPSPKGDVRDETLAQFSAELNEHAGRKVGFEYMVRSLAVSRAQRKQIEAVRAEVFVHVKRAFEIGHRVIPDTGLELRETAVSPAVTYRAAESAAVKKADKAAWQRAQVRERWVSVRPPADLDVPVIGVPTVPGFLPPAEATMLYHDHPAWEKLRFLREDEKTTVDRLEKTAADFGWDGDPLIFADGWTVQLARYVFSSEALAANDPALFDQLAVVKARQAARRVYVRTSEDDGYEGD